MENNDYVKALVHFLDSIRDYENESGKPITHDERESEEFVEIYLKGDPMFDMVSHSEMEEFGRKAFYAGRVLNDLFLTPPTFKRPTYNGYLRELDKNENDG